MVSVFTFWYRSIEESFLYTKICFVTSRTLYLPSYGSKKSGRCNIRSNVHCNFLQNFSTGDPGTFLFISPLLHGLETSNLLEQ